MQRKTAEQWIDRTQHLIGRVLGLQILDRSTGYYQTRQYRIRRNDRIVNLEDPNQTRVCLDVYAEAEDTVTGERTCLSLEKLTKQRE